MFLRSPQQLPRYSPDGAPFDVGMTLKLTIVSVFLTTWVPAFFNWLLDLALARISRAAFPDVQKSWGFDPAPSIATTNPIIADEIYPLLTSGYCEPVPSVRRVLGPAAVELADGRVLERLDAIVYCTGYDLAVPFVAPEHNPYPVAGGPSTLYRGTFPIHPDPDVRASLAFLGHGFVRIPGFVQHEVSIMAVIQVWKENTALPPLADMERWRRGWLAWRGDLLRQQPAEATFYVGMMPLDDHVRWFDQAAGTDLLSRVGWFSRKAWSFWWNDRELYHECANRCFSPAIWRLFETGKRKAWAGARQQILSDNLAVQRATERQKAALKLAENRKTR